MTLPPSLIYNLNEAFIAKYENTTTAHKTFHTIYSRFDAVVQGKSDPGPELIMLLLILTLEETQKKSTIDIEKRPVTQVLARPINASQKQGALEKITSFNNFPIAV